MKRESERIEREMNLES